MITRIKGIRALSFICLLGILLSAFSSLDLRAAADEANDGEPLLVLEAEKAKLEGNASASGEKVGNVGKNGGTVEGRVVFEALALPYDGDYILRVHYYSGSDDRYFNVTSDYGKYKLDCPSTGSFSKVGTITMNAELKSGGTLVFGSDWYGPDLDKIEIIETEQIYFPDREYTDANDVKWEDIMTVDTNNGTYSVLNKDKIILKNVRAEAVINGITVSSDDFAEHTLSEDKDNRTLTVTHTSHKDFSGSMIQTFKISDDGYLMTKVTLTSGDKKDISTNYIAPVAVYQNSVGIEKGVFLKNPYDNDMWVEPAFISVGNLQHSTNGYEVAAYYNEETSAGLVLGSLEHDTWKTGINILARRSSVMGMTLYAGAADENTRDNSPHGSISSPSVSSPMMFVGFFDDWREGLTAYGKANAELTPPKTSVEKVPIGFNSWGQMQSSVKYSDMLAVSDYIEKYLQESWTDDGAAVYVNIDSYWDFITANDPDCKLDLNSALRSFVLYCKKNGQKAGVYFTPFACWYSTEEELRSNRLTGSDGKSYTYYDAAIKKSDGSGLYGKLDGGWALDPTHPATIKRFEDQLNSFVDLGFEYVKLDFMAHGAVEGQHFDPKVTTGMQAYNQGMARIAEICNGKMYVNLSIAPLFPYQYADGRRISCDAFSSLDNTMHVLSYLTACFWEEEIYPYPDPDHLVVTGVTEGVARCRVTAGAITGTSFLIGDDLSKIKEGTADHKRILKMYANTDIISVAKLGRTFTPLTVNAGERCANIYWCTDSDHIYVAAFNFDMKKTNLSVDLSSLVDSLPEGAVAKELWSGDMDNLRGMKLTFSVKGQDAVIYRIGAPIADDESGITENEEDKDTDKPTLLEKLALPLAIITALTVVLATALGTVFVIRRRRARG